MGTLDRAGQRGAPWKRARAKAIFGCAEYCQSTQGADLFLTGGEEEEILLIESDGEQVTIHEVGDYAAQAVLTAPLGGSYAFERIEKRLLKQVIDAVRSQPLCVKTADWVDSVKAWTEQYVSLQDTLLEVKEGQKAQRSRAPCLRKPERPRVAFGRFTLEYSGNRYLERMMPLAGLINRLRSPEEREYALMDSAFVFEIVRIRAAGRVVRDEDYPEDLLPQELRDTVLSHSDFESLIDEVASHAQSQLGRVLFALGKVADFRGAMRTAETVVAFRTGMSNDHRYQAVVSLQNHDRDFGRLQNDERILHGVTTFLSECCASSWTDLATLAACASQTWAASRASRNRDEQSAR